VAIGDRPPQRVRGRIAEQPLGGRVPGGDPAVRLGRHEGVLRGVQHRTHPLRGQQQLPVRHPQGDLGLRGDRQRLQQSQLRGRPLARLGVDHTERTEHRPVRRVQRKPRVRDEPEVADGGIVPYPHIGAGVRHHERRVVDDHVPAEGMRQRRMPQRRPRLGQTDLADEGLPVRADQRHQRDGRVRQLRGGTRQPVQRGVFAALQQTGLA
jgi:hypothetical protein